MSTLENRYLVLKWKDIEAADLSLIQRGVLLDILASVASARELRGAAPLECVVVEKDWPEYDEVVSRILCRDQLG